jgi:hypothetical protein
MRVEPSNVTAVPAEVVTEVLSDPARFLAVAMEAAPGWANRYGGADGVAELTSVLQEQIAEQPKLNAELRAAAFTFLRVHRRRSLASIAQQVGITPTSVMRAIQRRDEGARNFTALEAPSAWVNEPPSGS